MFNGNATTNSKKSHHLSLSDILLTYRVTIIKIQEQRKYWPDKIHKFSYLDSNPDMLKILLLHIALLLLSRLNGQTNFPYEEAIARAGLFHLQKKPKDAILYYEKAFLLQQPNDALNAYKAAGVYALDSNIDKACYYLELAIQSGWKEADLLAADPYFDYLRKAAAQKWIQLSQRAFAAEKEYEKSLILPALRRKINAMTRNDQLLRFAKTQANSKAERQQINQEIHVTDSNNRVQAKAILNQYGWPKISQIGKDGQNNYWLLVQHADDDILFQETALAAMQQWRGTNEIDLENYAFLYDRVQCNLNFKQLYGTQVNWSGHGEASGFRSIIREDSVDDRRKALGLLPLQLYALTYGFVYNNLSPIQAKENDSSDLANTRRLIDSAHYFHARKAFQQVYDAYNAASMIAGGMSNAENFEAALLFANIASRDSNPQYKSIALDFLNLLYLRKYLTKQKLESQQAFKILHNEPRWIEMNSQL